MTTDNRVTYESSLVNVKLPSGSIHREDSIFSDRDIIKLYNYCAFLTPLTSVTWLQNFIHE